MHIRALGWVTLLACAPGPEGRAPSDPSADPPAPVDPALAEGPAGVHLDGDRLVIRVPTRAAERVEVWWFADPHDAGSAWITPLQRVGDRMVGEEDLSTLEAAGVTDLWYGLRAWGPNWPYHPDWSPGTEHGFLQDVDGLGNRFNPNKLLIDPWARELSHDPRFGELALRSGPEHRTVDSASVAPKGLVLPPLPPVADKPRVPLRDAVVYEVHVRGLTMHHPEVPEALRGTYAGAAWAAPYLADLGVTAIELLPLHETTNDHNDDDPGMANYWGYSSLSWFAPDRRYAADQAPGGPTRELREMVEAFHAHGLEVWVDVVYNHTAEGGAWDEGRTAAVLSWRGLDNAAFYQLDGPLGYRDDNGVGPNVNVADPLARELILDSLAYWTDSLGVDGYRYDLAAVLGNRCAATCFDFDPDDPDGLLRRIPDAIDAVHVAEPWAVTSWQGGNFPDGWVEWNDGFRDRFRAHQNALGQTSLTPRQLLDAFAGSPSRFQHNGRQPWHSVNFLTAHDGFTLADLYRCNDKDNGQPWPWGPSDGGSDHNLGWDQGGDPSAQRQAMRTGMAWLALSAGVPMLVGGDEWRRTQQCNNNPYNIDSPAMWLDWAQLETDADHHAFTRGVLALRAALPALRPETWRGPDALVPRTTTGEVASDAYLDASHHHALAIELPGDPDLLVLLNGWIEPLPFTLPPGEWEQRVDTHARAEADPFAAHPASGAVEVGERSLMLLERR